jgi:hypothetical protein
MQRIGVDVHASHTRVHTCGRMSYAAAGHLSEEKKHKPPANKYKTTPHAPPSTPSQNKTEGTKRWRLSLSLFLSLCLSHTPWRMSQAHQPPSSPLLPASSASCTTLRRSSRIEEVLRCRSSSGSALRESSADKVSSGLQIAQDKHTWLCDPCYATLRSDVGGSTYIENHEPLQTFPHITQRAYTCLRMA